MGRKRTAGNKHLPLHLHKKGNYYYYVTPTLPRKWIKLSKDYPLALSKWAELEGSCGNTGLIKSAIERYQSEILPTLANSTQDNRPFQLIKLLDAFGHMRFEELHTHHIYDYLQTRDKKVAANREISILSTIFRNAINWGWTNNNPCFGVFKNKETGRDRYITDQELLQIKQHADDQMKSIIDLAYITGMRQADIRNLKLADILDNGIYVKQGKTGKRQLIEMTNDLAEVVKKAKKSRKLRNITYLFTNIHGNQLTKSGFSSAWTRLRKKADLTDINFHDIRAKAITDAKNKGGLDYAQSLGGHTNQSQTEHYVKQKEVEKVKPLNVIL